MIAKEIAQNWLDECCRTIQAYDHAAHMNLISEDIKVYGVPGFEVIGYEDWYSQCEYEFGEKLIASTSYNDLHIRSSNDDQVMFLTMETIRAADGTVDSHPIEIELTKEHDGKWRVTQERLLSDDQASRFGLATELPA